MKNILAFILLILISNGVSAFNMPAVPGIPGMGAADNSSGDQLASAADGQEAIVLSFLSTLNEIEAAQDIVLKALDYKKKSEGKSVTANKNIGKTELKEKVERSAEANKKINEGLKSAGVLSENAKKEIATAMIPMGKATIQMAKLSGEASKWFKSATGEMKSAGPMGIVKLKKKLGAGLYIAKTTPAILKGWGGTSKNILEFAKKNKIPTKGADGVEI